MPLQHSASQSAFESNLQEEMKTHPQKQALAIAYSIRRRAGGEPEVAKGEYKMTGKEAMAEHLRLLGVLASPSHQDDQAELARQAEELPEIAAAVAKAVRTVYLDMDGVLADYDRAAQVQGLDPKEAKDVPGFFRGLPVMDGALDAVEDMLGRGIKVVVLSTPPKGRAAEAEAEKRDWLEEHFPELEPDACFTQDKSAHGGSDDILVDDHPDWNGAAGFPGLVLKFDGPSSWEAVRSAAVAEVGQAPAAIAKSEHDLGDPPHPDPTPSQASAGNYQKAHWRLMGLDVSIENLMGSTRRGVDPDGQPWEVVMPYHYGYARGYEGADGDQIDLCIGPLMDRSDEVHIVNQLDPRTGEFDETKVFIGFPTREDAIRAYKAGRSDDPEKCLGPVITVPVEEFKRWLKDGNIQGEAILKAETSHVKAHYRNVNGKVVYIPGYDKATHGEHPEATLHQRTVYGAHKEGTHTLRATDAEDREAIKAAAAKAGVEVHHIKRAGANHHGRVGAYDVIHFSSEQDAKQVHDMLATQEELEAKLNPKGDDTSGFYSVKLGAAVKPEPSHTDPGLKADTTQQDLDQLDGLDDAVINYSHGISQATKIHGYIPGGGASSFKAIIDLLKKKADMLSKAGFHGKAADVHANIHEWEEKAKASQKQADYIEADLPVIVTQAQTTHNLGLFKLAAMIAMTKAQAEESKASPDPEKAKLWWTNAASFATLAQQK